jgi:hypothetical protein
MRTQNEFGYKGTDRRTMRISLKEGYGEEHGKRTKISGDPTPDLLIDRSQLYLDAYNCGDCILAQCTLVFPAVTFYELSAIC